jgi:hypothetical protein
VFIDETAITTNMVRGRCPRGERLVSHVPQGDWKTITFIADLRRLYVNLTGIHCNSLRLGLISRLVVDLAQMGYGISDAASYDRACSVGVIRNRAPSDA